MDNGSVIFNVKVSTLITCLASLIVLVAFGISAGFESGSQKLLEYNVLDPRVLNKPVLTDTSNAYIGRFTSTLNDLKVFVDPNCASANATSAYLEACHNFESTFMPIAGPLRTHAPDSSVLVASLVGSYKVLTAVFSLCIIAFVIGLALLLVYYIRKVKQAPLWSFGNWFEAVSGSFVAAYAVIVTGYRSLAKQVIWQQVPKNYPYILIRMDQTDHICWAIAAMGGIAALILYFASLLKCLKMKGQSEKIRESATGIATPLRDDALDVSTPANSGSPVSPLGSRSATEVIRKDDSKLLINLTGTDSRQVKPPPKHAKSEEFSSQCNEDVLRHTVAASDVV